MDISTEVAAIQAASEGSELRQPIVDVLNKLNSGSLPTVTAADAGKILKVGTNGWEVGEKSGYMPVPTATKQITENGTHDVTDYASAFVNVSDGGGLLEEVTIDLTSATTGVILPSAGYTGISKINLVKPNFTKFAMFLPDNLSTNGWTDPVRNKSITKNGGSWVVEDGKLVCNGSYFTFPVPNSNCLIRCKCTIASDFTPRGSFNWYSDSCIFGNEEGGVQRDWGIVVEPNDSTSVKLVIGSPASKAYANTTLKKGEEHTISALNSGSAIYLWIDDTFVAQINESQSGNHLSQMGLFWNQDNVGNSLVKGTITAIGIWSLTTLSGWTPNDTLPVIE